MQVYDKIDTINSHLQDIIDHKEQVAISNGNTLTYNYTYNHTPLTQGKTYLKFTKNGSEIIVGPDTPTDDDTGIIQTVDVVVNIVSYLTGQLEITFTTAPDNGTPIFVVSGYTFDDVDECIDTQNNLNNVKLVLQNNETNITDNFDMFFGSSNAMIQTTQSEQLEQNCILQGKTISCLYQGYFLDDLVNLVGIDLVNSLDELNERLSNVEPSINNLLDIRNQILDFLNTANKEITAKVMAAKMGVNHQDELFASYGTIYEMKGGQDLYAKMSAYFQAQQFNNKVVSSIIAEAREYLDSNIAPLTNQLSTNLANLGCNA